MREFVRLFETVLVENFAQATMLTSGEIAIPFSLFTAARRELSFRLNRVKYIRLVLFVGVMAGTIVGEQRSMREATRSQAAASPQISIEDVDRFYNVYDSAMGHPSAEELQHNYIDKGSEGLRQFAKLRRISGVTVANNIVKHPEVYSNARSCVAVLPRVRRRLEVDLRKLGDLYPEAKFPPVTIAVGHGKPVGVGSPVSGVQIGLEALCAVKWYNPNLEDRFVHVIAHEYVHVQQVRALVDDEHPTVLEASLIEGAADFIGELISGGIAYSYPNGSQAKELETTFVSDEDKTNLSKWLYNSTTDKQDDVGYWIGYRIVKCYYQHARDKREALREIIQMSDPKAFIAKSGWYPGIPLD